MKLLIFSLLLFCSLAFSADGPPCNDCQCLNGQLLVDRPMENLTPFTKGHPIKLRKPGNPFDSKYAEISNVMRDHFNLYNKMDFKRDQFNDRINKFALTEGEEIEQKSMGPNLILKWRVGNNMPVEILLVQLTEKGGEVIFYGMPSYSRPWKAKFSALDIVRNRVFISNEVRIPAKNINFSVEVKSGYIAGENGLGIYKYFKHAETLFYPKIPTFQMYESSARRHAETSGNLVISYNMDYNAIPGSPTWLNRNQGTEFFVKHIVFNLLGVKTNGSLTTLIGYKGHDPIFISHFLNDLGGDSVAVFDYFLGKVLTNNH